MVSRDINCIRAEQMNQIMFKNIFFLLLLSRLSAAQGGGGDLRFVFYNVENLFDPFDDSLTLDEEFTPAGSRHWTWDRFLRKELAICKVLVSAGDWEPPALIGLCEVENRFVLDWLSGRTPLMKYHYSVIHRNSPDERGIDVALLYRSPAFRVLAWQYIPVPGPADPTRDVLYVKGLAGGRDTLHLVLCHFPSRWEGYLESLSRRKDAARTVRTLLDTLLRNGPERRVLVAGDLNDELSDPGPGSVLRIRVPGQGRYDTCLYDTCLYHTGPAAPGSGPPGPDHPPGTLKYRGTWYEFDHIFASGHFFSDSLLSIRPGSKTIHMPAFLMEKDPGFPGDRPFRTYAGYRYLGGYSDHLPVYIDLVRRK